MSWLHFDHWWHDFALVVALAIMNTLTSNRTLVAVSVVLAVMRIIREAYIWLRPKEKDLNS